MKIISYMGGLGNLMFQYALYRALESKGEKVVFDKHWFFHPERYHYTHKLYLIDLFPKIQRGGGYRGYGDHSLCAYIGARLIRKTLHIVNQIHCESNEVDWDEGVLTTKRIYLAGYFQNENYFKPVSAELREEFAFPYGEEKLQKMIERVESNCFVSLHVRRGNYLEGSNAARYGGICDADYYQRAIEMMLERVENPRFLVFSNDIEWVKDNMEIPNAEYVTGNMFDRYEDWYDMCLMSHCHHNIIANSTFSWWGAWLNNHPGKIVVCPERWENLYPNRGGICCDGWLMISGENYYNLQGD